MKQGNDLLLQLRRSTHKISYLAEICGAVFIALILRDREGEKLLLTVIHLYLWWQLGNTFIKGGITHLHRLGSAFAIASLPGLLAFVVAPFRVSVGYFLSYSWPGLALVVWWAIHALRKIKESPLPLWFARTSAILCVFYAAWLAFCSVISPEHEEASKLFQRELVCYVSLSFYLVTLACESPTTLRRFALGAGVLTVGAIAIMFITGLLYLSGLLPPSLVGMDKWIRLDGSQGNAPWHLQFPFAHHNRAGFFAMCAVFLLPLVVFHFSPKVSLPLTLLPSLIAIVVQVFTLTRGALLGTLGGCLTLLAWSNATIRRTAGYLGVSFFIVLALVVALSPVQKSHLVQLVDLVPDNNTPPTSTGARIIIQNVALTLAIQRPITGWGYGFSVFERVASQQFPELARSVEGMSHPHNHFIEQLVAGGIPAILLFAGFSFLRILGLGYSMKYASEHRNPLLRWALAAWFALEIAIVVYGLTNTSLRRNLGLLTYTLWAGSFILALWATSADEADETLLPTASRRPE